MKAFEEKILSTVQRHGMLNLGEKVLVAVSGGVDSLTLLSVLRRLPLDLDLFVFHLNHGLRPESKAEAQLVAERCQKWSIPYRIIEINVKETKGADSVQVAARNERYRLLEETGREKGVSKIALGHHADDQVETMIMRFLTGAGPQGMAGIPPVRDKYIRPLFEVTREEIKTYAEEEGLIWAEDASNLKTNYFRNKIRLCLIPFLLEEFQPQLTERLMEAASIFQEWEALLLQQVKEVLDQWGVSKRPTEVVTPASAWTNLPKALERTVFREVMFRMRPGMRLEFKHSQIFRDLVEGENGRRISLPEALEGLKEKDQIMIRAAGTEESIHGFYLALNIPGCTQLPSSQGQIEVIKGGRELLPSNWQKISKQESFFDWDQLAFPLGIRSRKRGDRLYPLGLNGSKKLKELFSDFKVGKQERERTPLLVDAEDEVLWVVGMRSGMKGRITEQTENVLYFKHLP